MRQTATLLGPVLALLAGGPCWAAPPSPAPAVQAPLVYAIIVGNNDGLGMLPQLSFADDDALRFYDLAVQLAPKENVALLTELDVDTWRRIQRDGGRPPPFLPPTRVRLLEVIRLFKQQITAARAAVPERPVHFYFFFSGHGERGYFFLKRKDGPLANAAFTGTDLERSFADSPATLNWLFIDACKSQSLFVPKGKAGDDELGPDFGSFIERLDRAVARSPIGVLTSTLSDKPAGEARDIRGGYFSHVLISGLRGAADADSDGVVRYGELAAFVSFHTRRIAGQRPWFRPPMGKLNEPLITLTGRPHLLEILPGLGGHLVVLDGDGRRIIMEAHKTAAQHTRLILTPGRYRVVWIQGRDRGVAAQVALSGGAGVSLSLADFQTPVLLGPDRRPRGDLTLDPPVDADPPALSLFDPAQSGFDQPFTTRVVDTTAAAYGSGLTMARPAEAAERSLRHQLAVGYGYMGVPVSPMADGQGVSLAYGYRLEPLPLQVGARAMFGFSDHNAPVTQRPFTFYRVMLQAEVGYIPLSYGRLTVMISAYAGWQLSLITREALTKVGEDEQVATVLNGDAAGFRAGGALDVRLDIYRGLWASVNGAFGLELVNQDSKEGESRVELFGRPQLLGQVGYAF